MWFGLLHNNSCTLHSEEIDVVWASGLFLHWSSWWWWAHWAQGHPDSAVHSGLNTADDVIVNSIAASFWLTMKAIRQLVDPILLGRIVPKVFFLRGGFSQCHFWSRTTASSGSVGSSRQQQLTEEATHPPRHNNSRPIVSAFYDAITSHFSLWEM